MNKKIARLALSATEVNRRASLLSLTEDGVKVTAFDKLPALKKANDAVDHKATAARQAQAAKDFFVEAVTPDKALIIGAVGQGVGSAALGLVADVVEAIPAAGTAAVYAASATVHALWGAVTDDDGKK